jgi:HSP20 family molecular chaperone IbpA
MNTIGNKIIRTNKTSTTLIIGAITLAAGLAIGAAAAKAGGSAGAKTDATASGQSHASPSVSRLDQWNPFQQMRQMQAQMDQMFNQMTRQFQSEPGFNGFADIPGCSLSLDVRDLKDHYEVRAYLPDAKASNVHVNLTNDQTLKVEVDRQQTAKSNRSSAGTNALTRVTDWGQYEQTVQLPTPVKSDQMKINRKGHELIITIPKQS